MSNFHPDTGGRRWSLVQVHRFSRAVGREGRCRQISVCGEHSPCSSHAGFAPLMGACFPRLHCSGSQLLYMEWALRCMRFQFSGTTQKHRFSWACVLCLPQLSSSGSQELDGHSLPRCGAPSPLHGPSLSFHSCQSDACGLCLFLGAGL